MQMALFNEEPKRLQNQTHHKPSNLDVELIKEVRAFKFKRQAKVIKFGRYYEVPSLVTGRVVGMGYFKTSHIVSLGERILFTIRTEDGEIMTTTKFQMRNAVEVIK